MLSSNLAWGQGVNLEQIKDVEANLCALEPTVAGQPTEASFCPECAIDSVSPTPKALAVDELSDLERREIQFLEQQQAAEPNYISSLEDGVEKFQPQIKIFEKRLLEANQFLALPVEPSGHFKVWPKTYRKSVDDAIKLPLVEFESTKWLLNYVKSIPDPKQVEHYSQQLDQSGKKLNELVHLQTNLSVSTPGTAMTNQVVLDPSAYATLKKIFLEQKNQAEEGLKMIEKYTGDAMESLKAAKLSLASQNRLKSIPPGLNKDRLQALRERARWMSASVKRNPGYRDCNLTEGEVLALTGYTGKDHKVINEAMRRGGTTLEQNKNQIELINNALKKFKTFKGTVRRGVNLPPAILAEHQPGQVVDYKAYSSTSLGLGFSARHQFVIHSKTGRYIAPYSKHRSEYEVLIPPAKFKVISRKELPDAQIEFVLEEVD